MKTMILLLAVLPVLLLAQSVPFSIVITFDNFPEDISWQLFFADNDQRIGQGTTNAAGNLPVANYRFEISDSFGDGLCCSQGSGSYNLRTNNINFFTSDGQFDDGEVVEFSINSDGSVSITNGMTSTTPNPPTESGFNIELVPADNFDVNNLDGGEGFVTALEQAAARWSEVIIGDLPDVGDIDDLRITYDFSPIDGVSNVIGSAGPTRIRSGSLLPFEGQMTFDSADVGRLSDASLEALFLHEMGHILGVGTLWRNLGLSECEQGNPNYLGSAAQAAFLATPNANAANLLIEQDGGGGTACGHFDEVQLQSEVMTGFLTVNPTTGISEVSTITIGTLQDMGYTVNFDAADDYIVPASALNAEVIMDLTSDMDDFEYSEDMMEDVDSEQNAEMLDLDEMMAGSSNVGAIVGVSIGSVAIVGVAAGFIYRKRKQADGTNHVQLVES